MISFKFIFLIAGLNGRRRPSVDGLIVHTSKWTTDQNFSFDRPPDGQIWTANQNILTVVGGGRADRWTEVRPRRPASECTHVNNEFSDQLKVIATSLWLSLRLLNYSFLEYSSRDLFQGEPKTFFIVMQFRYKNFLTLGINFISKSTITLCKTIWWFALKILFRQEFEPVSDGVFA